MTATAESPLRCLFLTQTYPRSDTDTAGPFIRELARALVRAGDAVTVLVPHARGVAPGWDDGGARVVSFRYAPERLELLGYGRSLQADESVRLGAALAAPCYLLGARRAVRRELASDTFDLVHAHWIVPNGLAAAAVGRSGPAALAIGLHGSDVFLAERRLLRRWVVRSLRRCALLTGCSPELVERVRSLGPPSLFSEVIPYGVDSETFAPGIDGGAREWRARLALQTDDVVLLGVGRMATKKGFQVLVPRLDALFERFPRLRVVLAGGGDRESELKRATARFGGRVAFPGSVTRDLLPALFRSADLFVLPAVHDAKGNVDGLPNVILEAMASGLPVVASDVSGIPLAIRNGREGLLVPEADGEALESAIATLVESPDTRREMGRAARQRVVDELTWDRVAARHRAAYRSALETLGRTATAGGR